MKHLLARLVRHAILAVSAPDGYEDINGQAGDQGEPAYQHTVRRMQQYGFRSRMGPGGEVVALAVEGGSTQRVTVASEAPGTGPTDQEDWEVEIYAKFGQRIRLTQDGDVIVLPKVGRKVKLGSDDDGQLDAVALYSQLRTDFNNFVTKYNNHTHALSGVQAGTATLVTALTPDFGTGLSASVASSNVVAKKP